MQPYQMALVSHAACGLAIEISYAMSRACPSVRDPVSCPAVARWHVSVRVARSTSLPPSPPSVRGTVACECCVLRFGEAIWVRQRQRRRHSLVPRGVRRRLPKRWQRLGCRWRCAAAICERMRRSSARCVLPMPPELLDFSPVLFGAAGRRRSCVGRPLRSVGLQPRLLSNHNNSAVDVP